MTDLAILADRAKGDAICTRLKELGLKPVWLEAVADQIVIGFEFISSHPTWTKAVRVDTNSATPDAFVRLVNEWKNKVRKDIYTNAPSTVVRNLIAAHGLHAVLDAMEETPSV